MSKAKVQDLRALKTQALSVHTFEIPEELQSEDTSSGFSRSLFFRRPNFNSPIERNLKNWIRLAPISRPEGKEVRKKHVIPGKILDGFLLLEKSGVELPEEAVEAVITGMNLAAVIAEDLAYYISLEFLDVGENFLSLESLVPLENLKELHIHCNNIQHIVLPEGCFPHLEILNLSYNHLSKQSVGELRKIAYLKQLDLSCNGIASLPDELSELSNLERLALEKNNLGVENDFLILCKLPNLREVNLNSNRYTRIPRTVDGFPVLETMSIADNQLMYFEDIIAPTEIESLKNLIVWGNPVCFRRRDIVHAIHQYILHAKNLYTEFMGKETKQKSAAFYGRSLMRVKDDVLRMRRRLQKQAEEAAAESEEEEGEEEQEEEKERKETEDPGKSFFITDSSELLREFGYPSSSDEEERNAASPAKKSRKKKKRNKEDGDVRNVINQLRLALSYSQPLPPIDPHFTKTTKAMEARKTKL